MVIKDNSFVHLLVGSIVLTAIGVMGYFLFKDSEPPTITLSPTNGKATLVKPFTIQAGDKLSGLASIKVMVSRGTQSMVILDRNFSDKPKSYKESFTLSNSHLPDGDFNIDIEVIDASHANFGNGNKKEISYTFDMDTKPPKISVLSPPPTIKRGGTALITYNTSDDVKVTGVRVEDNFFPAFRQQSGSFVCLFPFPYFLNRSNYTPEIFAEDQAGNITSSRLLVTIDNRIFPDKNMIIRDDFLRLKEADLRKIVSTAKADEPLIDIYKMANITMRQENEKFLINLAKKGEQQFTWQGAFLHQPNSRKKTDFGESYTYIYKGDNIDYQFHTGYDLTFPDKAKVRAVNKAKVLYTGFLGVLGNTVVLDHGRNLQSMYSHLSEINVEVGELVEANAIIGTIGSSGLVTEEHLHLSFLVGGIPVRPDEWLDALWVRQNITSRMRY